MRIPLLPTTRGAWLPLSLRYTLVQHIYPVSLSTSSSSPTHEQTADAFLIDFRFHVSSAIARGASLLYTNLLEADSSDVHIHVNTRGKCMMVGIVAVINSAHSVCGSDLIPVAVICSILRKSHVFFCDNRVVGEFRFRRSGTVQGEKDQMPRSFWEISWREQKVHGAIH